VHSFVIEMQALPKLFDGLWYIWRGISRNLSCGRTLKTRSAEVPDRGPMSALSWLQAKPRLHVHFWRIFETEKLRLVAANVHRSYAHFTQ